MNPTIGLLGLYLKLYDDKSPEMRLECEAFYEKIAVSIACHGIEVRKHSICRVASEFNAAVEQFKNGKVDVLVTVHLAYSPSLESIDSLVEAPFPLVILNTTPDRSFGTESHPGRVSYNHGIHGVQDLCSVLLKRQRKFFLETGHWESSDVLERVVGRIRAIWAAKAFVGARVGVIGEAFGGMGDFLVDKEFLFRKYGIETEEFPLSDPEKVSTYDATSKREVEAETQRIEGIYRLDGVTGDALEANVRSHLKVKNWLVRERLSAFTFNFLSTKVGATLDRVPFLSAATAMYDGIGYAGECDILTAALTSTLLRLNPLATFTEMFCPDWENNRIFMSHMGEINPRVCPKSAALVCKDNRYTDSLPSLYSKGQFMKGDAILVNLVEIVKGSLRMVLASVRVHEPLDSPFVNAVHGWIEPKKPLNEFLTEYSLVGGTHHSVLVYSEKIETLVTVGKMLDFEVIVV